MKYWFILILLSLTLACKPPIGSHLKTVLLEYGFEPDNIIELLEEQK